MAVCPEWEFHLIPSSNIGTLDSGGSVDEGERGFMCQEGVLQVESISLCGENDYPLVAWGLDRRRADQRAKVMNGGVVF